jgi:hypothetical protein
MPYLPPYQTVATPKYRGELKVPKINEFTLKVAATIKIKAKAKKIFISALALHSLPLN